MRKYGGNKNQPAIVANGCRGFFDCFVTFRNLTVFFVSRGIRLSFVYGRRHRVRASNDFHAYCGIEVYGLASNQSNQSRVSIQKGLSLLFKFYKIRPRRKNTLVVFMLFSC